VNSRDFERYIVANGGTIEPGRKHRQIRWQGRLVGILPSSQGRDFPRGIANLKAQFDRARKANP
jgi:hypothetical protein